MLQISTNRIFSALNYTFPNLTDASITDRAWAPMTSQEFAQIVARYSPTNIRYSKDRCACEEFSIIALGRIREAECLERDAALNRPIGILLGSSFLNISVPHVLLCGYVSTDDSLWIGEPQTGSVRRSIKNTDNAFFCFM